VFDWLFEGRQAVYVLLFLAGCVLLVLWWQRRDRRLLLAAGAVAGVALFYFLLSLVRETDRTQIFRKMDEMKEAINQKDLKRFLAHVSDDFQAYGMNKKALREETESAIDRFGISNASIKDLAIEELDREKGWAKVSFLGTADNSRTARVLIPCDAEFVREKDGQWRMKSITFHKPYADSLDPWNPFTER
jgi:ketosteroid isomerase-like protein